MIKATPTREFIDDLIGTMTLSPGIGTLKSVKYLLLQGEDCDALFQVKDIYAMGKALVFKSQGMMNTECVIYSMALLNSYMEPYFGIYGTEGEPLTTIYPRILTTVTNKVNINEIQVAVAETATMNAVIPVDFFVTLAEVLKYIDYNEKLKYSLYARLVHLVIDGKSYLFYGQPLDTFKKNSGIGRTIRLFTGYSQPEEKVTSGCLIAGFTPVILSYGNAIGRYEYKYHASMWFRSYVIIDCDHTVSSISVRVNGEPVKREDVAVAPINEKFIISAIGDFNFYIILDLDTKEREEKDLGEPPTTPITIELTALHNYRVIFKKL